MHLRFGGGAGDGGPGEAPDLTGLDAEIERFSSDSAWMPRLVLMAKSTYVWLDQLSRRYRRDIRTLDAIPDEELDRLARWGITGLWLIGLWERSRASQRIKALARQPRCRRLRVLARRLPDRRRPRRRGRLREPARPSLGARASGSPRTWCPTTWASIRTGSSSTPSGSCRCRSPPTPPTPSAGDDLSDDDRVEVQLEDHYWDNSDAAVVFGRRDRWTGETRYIYHGNDGTSFPWNDTAQLDFSRADVREQVIQTILAVARRFPVIRFDAAMVLAAQHVRRLWFPAPGEGGGAIPSRAEHGR